MGVVKGYFDKMCTDAITRYTNKKKIVAPDELQILLCLSDISPVPETGFMLMKNYKGLEKVSAKNIIDTKLDLRGRAQFLEAHTGQMLMELVQEYDMQWPEIRVVIELKGNDVKAHLYRGEEYKMELDMNELLSDEKMMQENG